MTGRQAFVEYAARRFGEKRAHEQFTKHERDLFLSGFRSGVRAGRKIERAKYSGDSA